MSTRMFHTARGSHYRFDFAGDGIARHSHPKRLRHSVHVLLGAVKVYGPHVQAFVYGGGTLLFDSMQPHEIRALEPETIILNRYEEGTPAEWLGLPEEVYKAELTGEDDEPRIDHLPDPAPQPAGHLPGPR